MTAKNLKWKNSGSIFQLGIIVLIWIFIRFGFRRITTTFDEAYYLSTVKVGGIYSGLVTPYLLKFILFLFGDPVKALLLVSLIFFLGYYLALLKFHRRFSSYKGSSLVFLFALVLSSHYLWVSNEVRPQQVGALFFLIILLAYNEALQSDFAFHRLFLLVVLWFLLVVSHVLSFLLALVVIVGFSMWELFRGRVSQVEYFSSVLPSIVGIFGLLALPQYRTMVFSIKWMLKHSSVGIVQTAGWYFSAVLVMGYLGLVVLGYAVAIIERRFGHFERIRGFLLDHIANYYRWYLFAGIVSMIVLILVQIHLNSGVYSRVYRGNFFLLFIMQFGNLIFNSLLWVGLLGRIRRREFNETTFVVILVGIVSILGLFISFFMPSEFGNFGFTNWMVRVYQYLVLFGVPLVAEMLSSMITRAGRIAKTTIIFVLLIGTIMSALNVARPPMIYDYPYYWTESDLNLIPRVGPGFVFLKDTLAPPKNGLALNFLGWAYGVNIKPVPRDLPFIGSPDLCVGDLCHSPYPYTEVPIGSIFFKDLQVLPGDCPKGFSMWAERIVSAVENENGESAVIMLGNSTLSPQIKYLEEEYLVPVVVNYSIIEGPTFKYYHAIKEGRRKGDIKMSYFVIQSVIVNSTSILIVSAPSLDGVAAGVWVVANIVSTNRELQNASWIVGVWRENDGKVLPFLKAYPNDANGFSYGDDIEIITFGSVRKP